MAETRTYQGHTYTRSAPGQPWQLFGPASGGVTLLSGPNPKFPLEVKHQQNENIIQQGEIDRQGALSSKARSDAATAASNAAEASARAQYAKDFAKAQRDKAVADAALAQQNVGATAPSVTNSNVHGDQYLAQIPPEVRSVVKAVASGNLAPPTGYALTKPYWQSVIQHVINYDPSFAGQDYGTRAKMRAALAGGPFGNTIAAINTALQHGGAVAGDVAKISNFGGLATPFNYPVNAVEGFFGDPRQTNFANDTRHYGAETAKVFANGGSAGEREDESQAVPMNGSPSQQYGVLQHNTELLKGKLEALDDEYKRAMGPTNSAFDLLSPEARTTYNQLLDGMPKKADRSASPPAVGLPSAGGTPPANGALPPGSGPGPTPPSGGSGPSANQSGLTPTTGDTRSFFTKNDRAMATEAQAAFAHGANRQQIDAIAAKYGQGRYGPDLDAAIEYRNRTGNTGVSFTTQPSGHEKTGIAGKVANFVGPNVGSFAVGGSNALTLNGFDRLAKMGDPNNAVALDLAKQNALPYAFGEVAGSILPTMGAARGLGLAAKVVENPFTRAVMTNPLTADTLYNGAYGAATSENPWKGAAVGAGLGLGMHYGASKIGGAVARAFKPSVAEALSSGEAATLKAANKTGMDSVVEALTNADQLGVAATLADVSPEVGALTGAAIRRSPTVAGMAREILIPRGRGQIDRFAQAIERDLGPVANVPQLSADLGRQAATDAAPLYEKAFAGGSVAPLEHQFGAAFADSSSAVSQAQRALIDAQNRATQTAAGVSRAGDNVYGANAALRADGGAQDAITAAEQNLAAAQATHQGNLARLRQAQLDGSANKPGAVWSPRIQQFLDDPIAKTGLARGMEVQRLESLAAGKPFDPTELAITGADEAGNPIVGAVPNMRTLDAVKRGFDEILNDYPRLPSGQLVLDQRGRAVDQVRKSFLGHLDSLNYDYAAARAAYAGPMASRDALDRGRAFFGMTPDNVGVAIQGQTPEQLAQMQLGYRSQAMGAAENYRLSSNPFEGVFGSRASEDRLKALYGNTPSVANLLAQRDLEGQLAGSSNRLIGNSMTAERGVADAEFAPNPIAEAALHAGTALATHGASLPVTAARFGGPLLKDRIALGLGQRAIDKADQIAPIALNTDPQETIANLLALGQKQQDYGIAKTMQGAAGARWGGKIISPVASALVPYVSDYDLTGN
jgi:hypothetical protein